MAKCGKKRYDEACSANEVAGLQAGAVEQGAIQYVLAHVDGLEGQVPTEADTLCEALRVGDGLFWILRPPTDDDRTYAYGIVDEASKVNLNSATVDMLSNLPGMTAEVPAAIVDWRDPDTDITPGGAESEHYLLLADPYECKDTPLETVEELFLVRGVTKEMMFGEDTNRNGVLDAYEDDAATSEPPDNKDGRLDRGVLDFVTVYSAERNRDDSGTTRVNVNDADMVPLAELLRQYLTQDRVIIVLDRTRRERPFLSVLDFYQRTGLTSQEFQSISNRLTTSAEDTVPGLINVNTAPKEALACLPDLEDADVSALLARRAEADAGSTDIAWVTEVLSPDKVAAVSPYITGSSYQFSADIVSLAGNGRAFRRCRIVVDASTSPPRIVYRQNLTHLGWPLAPQVIADLRAGVPPDEVVPISVMEAR